MANLQTTQDLRADILERADEIASSSSEYWALTLQYLNRQYYSLCLGGSFLAPDVREDWDWLRASPPGILLLESPISTGTVTATTDSATITFSSVPASSVTGWEFQPTGDTPVYRISAHTGGNPSATLDSVYLGTTGSGKAYLLRKVEYTLSSTVLRPLQPMRGLQYNDSDSLRDIGLIDLYSLERDYPRTEMLTGVPDVYALILQGSNVGASTNVPTVRFNRGGLTTGKVRIEYEYLRRPTLLTAADNEEPLVPHEWRGVLADMALYQLLLHKEDSRVDAIGLAAKTGIEAMAREHRKAQSQSTTRAGQIRPRPTLNRRFGRSRLWRA